MPDPAWPDEQGMSPEDWARGAGDAHSGAEEGKGEEPEVAAEKGRDLGADRDANGHLLPGHSVGKETRFRPGHAPTGGRPPGPDLLAILWRILEEECDGRDGVTRKRAEKIIRHLIDLSDGPVSDAAVGSLQARIVQDFMDRRHGKAQQKMQVSTNAAAVRDYIAEMRAATEVPPPDDSADAANPEEEGSEERCASEEEGESPGS